MTARTWILLVVIFVVVIIVPAISIFNRLVKLRNMIREAWSGIDVQLKRRYDLIPNIVQSVKGYAKHEKELFERVTNARANCINATNIRDKAPAENNLTGAIKSLFAVAENYPDLKANQNFMDLQKNLYEVEDQIQYSRRYYNGATRDYNILVESFPSMIIAAMCRFKKSEYFEISEPEERKVPKV